MISGMLLWLLLILAILAICGGIWISHIIWLALVVLALILLMDLLGRSRVP